MPNFHHHLIEQEDRIEVYLVMTRSIVSKKQITLPPVYLIDDKILSQLNFVFYVVPLYQ
jgi:hypothetical protein